MAVSRWQLSALSACLLTLAWVALGVGLLTALGVGRLTPPPPKTAGA